jgi:hypothetical protein
VTSAFTAHIILAYFPKMKVGLSNHQPVCLSPTNNFWVDFHEIWCRGNDIQGDLDAIIFNPLAPIILKLLRGKVVR